MPKAQPAPRVLAEGEMRHKALDALPVTLGGKAGPSSPSDTTLPRPREGRGRQRSHPTSSPVLVGLGSGSAIF